MRACAFCLAAGTFLEWNKEFSLHSLRNYSQHLLSVRTINCPFKLSNVANTEVMRTSYQVRTHEGESELLWILVFGEPDGVVFLLKMFPEIRKGDSCSVFVGIGFLPLVHVEVAAIYFDETTHQPWVFGFRHQSKHFPSQQFSTRIHNVL